ncbi:ABC transporter G family member 9 [Senna tora]|uniref:ABC transporter G family member 9 n=1 Tax=Senna tora TaxID=362788 RepID=A0A834TRX8_9FABA|nr:ABC transporter G family member 9 [Senna tora]
MEQERADLESQTMFYNNINNHAPVTLKFKDVVYKMKSKKGKAEEKVILKQVSGIAKAGEMLAMLGPSGSGKTTLLTALGGRLGSDSGHQILRGTITYNDHPFSNGINTRLGFVTQHDLLYPHLTVTETLVFTALLRLPNTLSKHHKVAQAQALISHLGLSKCKDSVIARISGGERKRVSIGEELVVNPSLLFVDEPTSGLDSTTAQAIVSTLCEVASVGRRTVVMTIHQPSPRMYDMFCKVLLLCEGSPLFFGKGCDALTYFSTIGYAPNLGINPSDFLLDLANGTYGNGIYTDECYEDHASLKQKLISAYKNNLEAQVKELVNEEMSERDRSELGTIFEERGSGERWPTSWFEQFSVLLKRGVKERKHDSFSALKIAQVLLVAFLSGLFWYKSHILHLQDQIGLIFFIVGFWSFLPLHQAIFTFPQERMMLKKERCCGMYRLSSYFFSKIVADLPMELILPTIFLFISYFLAGLKPNVLNFLYTLFTLLLNVLVCQGLGLALGAIIMDPQSANTLGSVVMLSFLLVSGYYVQHVPSFIGWIKYLSIIYYTFKLFVGSQYEVGDTYPCSEGQCSVVEFPAIKQMGLHLKGQVVAALALVIMLIGYRLVAYFALMRIGVTKKLV